MRCLLLLLCFGLAVSPTFPADPFFAPAISSGSITVRLYPTENVAVGAPVLVTFGVPFPRGSLTPAQLSTVRVLHHGLEIPAYVENLSPWRHFTDVTQDNLSVRLARIQINHAFTTAFPGHDSITVEWGLTTRSQNISTLVNPQTAWHLVTTGTFIAADSVREPDVFVTLPKTLMCQGLLRPLRMEPFADSIRETRDDPAIMAARPHQTNYLGQMYASKNFFYSIINEDDVRDTNLCRYKDSLNYECWLFERPGAMFSLYFRSGFLKPLREAVRAAEFYKRHIKTTGFLDLKPSDDAKYSYNEGFAYTYWLTGDPEMPPMITKILAAHKDTRTRWTPTLNFWTERHTGFKMLAYQIAYEVLGGNNLRDSVQRFARDLLFLQDGAGGQIPSGRVDGGLYHLGSQHDWDWDPDSLGASPWMSLFVLDPMIRIYSVWDSDSLARFIYRMGRFLSVACTLTSYNSTEGRKMWFPRYAILSSGATGQADEWSDNQHAMEVGAGTAYGYYFSLLTGTPDSTLRNRADALYYTADDCISDLIRPAAPASGLTAYRVGPYRQYNWQYRLSGAFSWALKQTGQIGTERVNTLPVAPLFNITPNPFRSTTAICFDVAEGENQNIQLSIFDITGARILAPVTGMLKSGRYNLSWNARNNPPGIYFIKMKMGLESEVRKAILIQ